jgi:hypothetical protein
MKRRAQTLAFRGPVEHRHEADEHLRAPGDAVVVRRGVDRSLTMLCPDGCGETLTINLDRRAGPAWRLYVDGEVVSLYPSVWRNTGCGSHFIVWKSHIYWCDLGEELHSMGEEFVAQVLSNLRPTLQSYLDIAAELDVVPWAVLSACHQLKRQRLVREGSTNQRGWFGTV